MKISREIVNFLFIFFIMIVMMIFFRLMNGLSTWISFFVPVFYGFIAFFMLYQKVRKKIILYIPFLILTLGFLIYIGIIIFRYDSIDPNLQALLTFILILFMVYTFLLTRAAIISITYNSNHLNRVLGLCKSFLIGLLFLMWMKYESIRFVLLTIVILMLIVALLIYLKDMVLKKRYDHLIPKIILGINVILMGLYFVVNPSNWYYFLLIVVQLTLLICLISKKKCSLFTSISEDSAANLK